MSRSAARSMAASIAATTSRSTFWDTSDLPARASSADAYRRLGPRMKNDDEDRLVEQYASPRLADVGSSL